MCPCQEARRFIYDAARNYTYVTPEALLLFIILIICLNVVAINTFEPGMSF